jgi:hypothetical protein
MAKSFPYKLENEVPDTGFIGRIAKQAKAAFTKIANENGHNRT